MKVVENNRTAHILIVEDDEERDPCSRNFLRRKGLRLQCASNGSDALREIAGKPFDLIITDIEMPGLTGWTFFRR